MRSTTRLGVLGRAVASALPLACFASCHHHHGSSTALSGLNRAPSAKLAVSGERKVDSPIHFDGRASSDPDGDDLSGEWAIYKKPASSALLPSSLGHQAAGLATLVPDKPGIYKVRLTVSDGELLATAAAAVQVVPGKTRGNGGHVALICPSRGYVTGGELVTITGGFFPAETQVRFGATLGLDAQVLEDGSVITVRTPPASAPGIVDITLELSGDEAILVPNAFTYLPGPLAIDAGDARDVPLARSPTALVALGGGRLLLGTAKGTAQLFTERSDGSVLVSEPLQVVQIGRVERLRAGKPRSDGQIEVGGTISDGSEVFVVRVAPDGKLSFISLPFAGQAVDLAILDFDSGGADEILVADRSNKRVVVYTATATGDGSIGDESFSQTAQFPTAGSACVLVTAQLDADPALEIVVGSLPGPAITLIDPSPRGIHVTDHDPPEFDGIILLEPADFYGRGRDSLAAITVAGGGGNPAAQGNRTLRVISLDAAEAGADPQLEIDDSVHIGVASGETGMAAKDLDGDQDQDLALFDGGSGDIRILINTLSDGPETPEDCDAIAETGSTGGVFGFRETRLHAFPRSGIRALAARDLDGDGYPELAASHTRDLQGLRILPNATGK